MARLLDNRAAAVAAGAAEVSAVAAVAADAAVASAVTAVATAPAAAPASCYSLGDFRDGPLWPQRRGALCDEPRLPAAVRRQPDVHHQRRAGSAAERDELLD